MKTKQHKRWTDFLYRPDEYDDYIIGEQGSYKHLEIQRGESVLDVGAHIGAFARWALDQGSGRVTSIEPEAENLELLYQNVHADKVRIIEGAVVGDDQKQVDLFVNQKRNKGLHATFRVRGRPVTRVPAFRFSKMIKKYKPKVLKVDIEGGEYTLDWDEALTIHQPRAIAVELHLIRKQWREREAEALQQLIRRHGYIGGVVIPGKRWTILAFFERK